MQNYYHHPAAGLIDFVFNLSAFSRCCGMRQLAPTLLCHDVDEVRPAKNKLFGQVSYFGRFENHVVTEEIGRNVAAGERSEKLKP